MYLLKSQFFLVVVFIDLFCNNIIVVEEKSAGIECTHIEISEQ